MDLERRTVADLLPERSAQQVEDWFKQHPGVEIVSRDRFGLYAKAAQRGAPQAQQVADRFHLCWSTCKRPPNTNSAGSGASCFMLILLDQNVHRMRRCRLACRLHRMPNEQRSTRMLYRRAGRFSKLCLKRFIACDTREGMQVRLF